MRAVPPLVLLLALEAGAAEPLALRDLDGRAVALAPAAEGALVAHFWATWCASCKDELPELDRASRACAGTNVEVVAIDVDEPADEVAQWLRQRPLALRVLLDPGGQAWRRSGGREMPANLIWTREGASWSLGPSSAAQWRERLAALGCRAPAQASSPGS
jgi:thiol-disulfide isomerase/thioredoxin